MILPEIYLDGTQFWCKDGKRHRVGGPAAISRIGSQFWYKNGSYHRDGGPAVMWSDGSQFWFNDGVQYDHS